MPSHEAASFVYRVGGIFIMGGTLLIDAFHPMLPVPAILMASGAVVSMLASISLAILSVKEEVPK